MSSRLYEPQPDPWAWMLDEGRKVRIVVNRLEDGTWGVWHHRRWSYVEPSLVFRDAPVYFEPGDYEVGWSSKAMAIVMMRRVATASWRGVPS